MKNQKKETKLILWVVLIIVIGIVYKVLDSFTGIGEWVNGFFKVLKPFLLAVLVAYLLYIPSRKIESLYKKTKIKFINTRARGLAVATTYLLALCVIILIINIILPTLSESILDLANNLPGYYENAKNYVNDLPDNNFISKETIHNAIKSLSEIDIAKLLNADNIMMYIEKAIGIASGLFNIFVTIVVSVYILLERGQILKFVKRLNSSIFSEKKCLTFNRYFIKGNEIFFKYISSQVLDAIVVAIIMAVALTLMKVKYAILLGFIIGLFNLIPYFGAIIAVIIAALITVFTGGITQAIWAVVVMVLLQQIDANIVNPKIVGDALEMSRILIVFSVTLGGAYFGVIGMFLGVPIIAVIKMMIDDYIDRNENKSIVEKTE